MAFFIYRYFQKSQHQLLIKLSFSHWIILSKLLCLKSKDYICMIYFWTIFCCCSIDLYVYSFINTIFVVTSEFLRILESKYSNSVPLSNCFGYSRSFAFACNFWIRLLIFLKNKAGWNFEWDCIASIDQFREN